MVIHHPTIINKLLDDDVSRYWSVTVITSTSRPFVGSISLTGNAPSPIDGVNRSLTRPARHHHVRPLEAAAVADATPVSAVNRGPRAMCVPAASEQGAQEAAANMNLIDKVNVSIHPRMDFC